MGRHKSPHFITEGVIVQVKFSHIRVTLMRDGVLGRPAAGVQLGTGPCFGLQFGVKVRVMGKRGPDQPVQSEAHPMARGSTSR